MSDCCKTPAQPVKSKFTVCKACGQKGRAVQRITLESLLLDGEKVRLGPTQSYYCPSATCDVVYFSNEDKVYFRKSDLRVRVGQKQTEDPVTVCYCFEHTRASVWQEIQKTGNSTVEAAIKDKVKARLCACEINNPQGSCCLGNVGKAVKEGFEMYRCRQVTST